MFLFSKKKKEKKNKEVLQETPKSEKAPISLKSEDPLNLNSQINADEGHLVCLNATIFLCKVASSTRGLFEQVCPLQDAQNLWPLFKEGVPPKSAALTGAVNAHAAASLLVYHLRDLGEPLCTCPLRESLLAAVSFSGPSKATALQVLLNQLPHQNKMLFKAICCGLEDEQGAGGLLMQVAEEHALYYGDGLAARKLALAQLFGPLIMRPLPSEEDPSRFERDVASSVSVVLDVMEFPWILNSAEEVSSSSETPVLIVDGSMCKDENKAIPIPLNSHGIRNMDVRSNQDDVDYDSDETNYLTSAEDPAHLAFVRDVQNTPQHVIESYEAAAEKGEALLKYSSRGKPVALYFFKMAQDKSQLRWAPISEPDDLKYGLLIGQVVEVRLGPSAKGKFAKSRTDTDPALRIILVLGQAGVMIGGQAGPQLELEALSFSSARLWATVVQRLVLERRDEAVVPVDALVLGTHRNWGAPETARRMPEGSRSVPVPSLQGRLPSAEPVGWPRHGGATARLLDAVAEVGPEPNGDAHRGGEMRPWASAATARAPPQTNQAHLVAGPATAREPSRTGVEARKLRAMPRCSPTNYGA